CSAEYFFLPYSATRLKPVLPQGYGVKVSSFLLVVPDEKNFY
ncbi:MAG: hypothetical protein RL392_1586, partial [Pseudomonadota bacterium]